MFKFLDKISSQSSILIIAFKGWSDAAEAATSAVDTIIKNYDSKKFASFEEEEFFAFARERPNIKNSKDGRILEWPTNDLYYIQDAIDKGAKLEFGGKLHKANSLLFEPTLLTNIKQNMLVFKRENFGPIVPILIFDKDIEAIEMANNTKYGLASYFFTSNPKRIWSLVDDSQNANYSGVDSSQTSNYTNVNDSQTPDWQDVA